MKKYLITPIMLIVCIMSSSMAQTQIFSAGSSGSNCYSSGAGCQPQPNNDVSANPVTGAVYLLKHEVTSNLSGTYADKIIRFDQNGNRLNEVTLRPGSYQKILAGKGVNLFVLSVHNDSVYITCYNQQNLSVTWSAGINNGAGPVEAFDMLNVFGYIYFGVNDTSGMHLYKLDKNNGAIVNSTHYKTSFASYVHGLDLEASKYSIFVAGYLDEPGTVNGDELCLLKFTNNLNYTWLRRYNNNLSMTNNSDRASHVRIDSDSIFVCGTTTRSSGDIDAVILKYRMNGNLSWKKVLNKGSYESDVDCAIDQSNGDVYLLQNATSLSGTSKIFVSRFSAGGTVLWSKDYTSTDSVSSPRRSIGYHIFADPNPGGNDCEIYVSGQRQDYGGDPHGYTNGTNLLFYKLNRSGTITVILAPDAGSGPGGLAPLIGLQLAAYYPDYVGGPRIILAGDGDYALTFPGFFGWTLMAYDISSVARLANTNGSQDVSSLRLSPNPTSGSSRLIAADQIKAVAIFNISGQEIQKIQVGNREVTIDFSGYRKGVYIIRADFNNEQKYSRVIVQ